jgi:hypothetical protein
MFQRMMHDKNARLIRPRTVHNVTRVVDPPNTKSPGLVGKPINRTGAYDDHNIVFKAGCQVLVDPFSVKSP